MYLCIFQFVVVLLLIASFIPLCLEKTLDMISVFLNFLRFVFCPNVGKVNWELNVWNVYLEVVFIFNENVFIAFDVTG